MIPPFPAHRYELDDPVSLDFHIQDQAIRVTVSHMEVVEQIVLFGSISIDMLQSAIQYDAFHLAGETTLPGWDPQQELELVLRLDGQIAQSFASSDDIFLALFQPDSVLTQAASWYALEAMQHENVPGNPEASTSFGIRTKWAG